LVAREGNITDTTHHPGAAAPSGPADRSAAPGRYTRALRIAAVAFLAAAAASAVCGIPAGFAWGALAPRVLVQVVAHGEAQIVNPETSAFIVADVWFCLIGVIGGLLTGALGYLIAVRRWGAPAAAGLIVGALAATALELWIGGLDGHAAFQHQLAVSAPGTFLHASLALGAKSGLTFWPLLTALTIAVLEIIRRWWSGRHGPDRDPLD
jgi:hypothetical protein